MYDYIRGAFWLTTGHATHYCDGHEIETHSLHAYTAVWPRGFLTWLFISFPLILSPASLILRRSRSLAATPLAWPRTLIRLRRSLRDSPCDAGGNADSSPVVFIQQIQRRERWKKGEMVSSALSPRALPCAIINKDDWGRVRAGIPLDKMHVLTFTRNPSCFYRALISLWCSQTCEKKSPVSSYTSGLDCLRRREASIKSV